MFCFSSFFTSWKVDSLETQGCSWWEVFALMHSRKAFQRGEKMLPFLPTWQHSLLSKSRQDLQGRDTDWHVGQESFLLPFRFQMLHPAQSRVSGRGEDGFSESLHTTLGGLGRGGAWVDRGEVLQSYFGSRKTCTLLQTLQRESLSGIVQVLHWISPPVLSPLLLYLECLFWALLKRCCGFVRVQGP